MHRTRKAFNYQNAIWLFILFLPGIEVSNLFGQQDPDCKNALEQATEMFDVKDYRGVVDKFINCAIETDEGIQKKRVDEILFVSTRSVFVDNKDYDIVIAILSKYPAKEFEIEKEQKITLYELLGESYIEKKGPESDAAQKTVTDLARLTLGANYEPEKHQLSGEFIESFRKAQQSLTANGRAGEGSGLQWVLIGGSAVAASVMTALLLTGGGSDQLPSPPGPPNGN